MVLESVVVDVLNRFLGDYVVNLDSSQLKLGIWGGDAVLKSLEIKENALSQLDLPFKVKAGHIGRLELKIPWTDIYNKSVEATLDGVYLLIVPTASIKYDAEKEEKQLQEARQRELQRIEETKLKAAEQENPTLEKQDTFMEKLVTQVIKNVQVKISNIHVRYEDDITNPNCPLSFGVSLKNLSLQTADNNWKPSLLDEHSKLFFKLVELSNLFAYWNVDSVLFSKYSADEALRCLQSSIEIQPSVAVSHDFIFRPISANAKLRMNPRSDVDFSSPKVDLMVNLSEVAIELNKDQYISILELLGSVDMMSRNLPYRKYRPEVHVHGNAHIWWKYVITGILEVDVKPRLHMWSWKHIRRHRRTVKCYKELYKTKITSKKPAEELLKELECKEKCLDIFNITLTRKQAEVEASKAGLRIYRPGMKMEEEESQGWFGWMWSWGGEAEKQTKDAKPGTFDELLTVEEKAKLYTAIGYSETAANPNLPKTFEDIKVNFHMEKLSVSIKDNKDKNELMKLTVGELKSTLAQRPGAQAIKITAKLTLFEVTGLATNRPAPTLLSSRKAATKDGNPLLFILFETNPLDESANQRLYVESEPLEIIYDAITVNNMAEFFRPSDDLQLDELTNATLMKLEQFRDRTATGLLYVIETQKVLDLKLNLMASYVIIPQSGYYDGKQNIMLLDLGHLKMSSQSKKDLPQLSVNSSNIADIMSRAYDSFDIQLSSLQFLYSKPGGDWKTARKQRQSPLHILEPVDLKVVFSRAMVVKDSRMPKYKMHGDLPRLSLRISDNKLRSVLELVDSIPLPESKPAARGTTSSSSTRSKQSFTPRLTGRKHLSLIDQRSSLIFESCETISITSLGSQEDLFYDAPSSPIGDKPFFPDNPLPLRYADRTKRNNQMEDPQKNMTDFSLRFEITELSVQLCRLLGAQEVVVLHLHIEGLGTELMLRTFDMSSSTFLREICLKCPEYMDSEDKQVQLITTLDNSKDDLLTLDYVKADKNGPEFKTQHNNTEQLIKVVFSSLDVHLHTEALLNTMNFLTNLLPQSTKKEAGPEELPTIPEEEEAEGEKEGEKREETAVIRKKSSKSSKFADVVNLHVRADLQCLKVFIRGQKARISEISIEGLVTEVTMRKKDMAVRANLRSIVILDCNKDALYKKAVSIADKQVFSFRMMNYTGATEGDAYLDMTKVDTSVSLEVGCIQVIFLNKFVSSILVFINNFQEAKEALAEVTVQAAEKAASGVKELAERSTRIALDVHFNAPVIFLPQSSSSTNVIVADLGLLSIKNHFIKQPFRNNAPIPPVVDKMTVKLTDLKMYRTTYKNMDFEGETQLLKPVSLNLEIQRNLSANWYHSIPDIEITAHLKPLSLILCQDDMIIVLRTLNENLSEKSETAQPPALLPATDRSSDSVSNKGSQGSGTVEPANTGNTVVIAAVVETQKHSKPRTTTLKLDFKFDSMTLVLYSPNENVIQLLDPHDEQLKLAEFSLGTISTSVHMFSDSSMEASVRLSTCLLDDKRPRIKMVTPRMMELRPGAEQNMMVEVNYRQGLDGTNIDTVVQDVYLCASMEFLLTVANIFLEANKQGFAHGAQPKNNTEAGEKKNINSSVTSKDSSTATAPVSKMEMTVVVRNPEVVFVADLTRADAPALVMTTQCEVSMKSGAESLMTAIIKDLKVMACPFLREMRKNNMTTILQPCQVFYESYQPSGAPQAMKIEIKAISLKVSPVIINTVITIQSALTPKAETPEELESPVPVDLWQKRGWKELKLWFLEEEKDIDTKSLTPLIPQGESLKLSIDSIFVTLEAGVGHLTMPMLLAKSSFEGDVKNWSTLINLHSKLTLEVHYYNEMMGVWEPLLEPLEDDTGESFTPWTLKLKMKKKAIKSSPSSDEVDYSSPDYKTEFYISSKDQLNITVSKCGLTMLSNLGTAFAEAAKQTAECFQKDEAPFVVKNRLGLPVSVWHSETFSPVSKESIEHIVELQDGESLHMDYSVTAHSDQFSAMTSLNEKDYYIKPTPVGHTSTNVIPLIKVGRGMYNVMHNDSGVTRFLVCQISSVEGRKCIKIRSPFQIINHFTVPFNVFEGSTCLGEASPSEEFCVPLDSYRSELSLQPIMENATADEGNQFDLSGGFSYEDICNLEPNSHLKQTCRCRSDESTLMTINIVPVKDTVSCKETGDIGENFDVPFVLHLWPSVLLRNLLPYPIAYKLKGNGVCGPEVTLNPGHSTQLHTALINQSSLDLRLLDYLAQDWSSEYRIQSEQEEITFIVFQSLRVDEEDVGDGSERKRAELDIAVHIKYDPGQTVVAIHSPYWMVNKTGRLLQYKADDIHRKHPLDYDMPLLFSFKPRNFLRKNKVRLMISDSELSDDFSLDTVGSHGDVKCKGRYKDYRVGVKIDASSFSLTRMVTFLPFYILVNGTKHPIFICEDGQDNWAQVDSQQSAVPFWPESDTGRLKIKLEGCLAPPQTIDFTKAENCLLLRLDNSVGGIIVDVNLTEHSTTIRFSDYHDGAAPFLLINHTREQTLLFGQSSQMEVEWEELEAGKAIYYTWTEPTGSRELCWRWGQYNGVLKVEKNEIDDQDNKNRELKVISFYEGLQHVVLFTEDQRIYKLLMENERLRQPEQEYILLLQNMGISLVNNTNSQEVSYIGITSSDVVWEINHKKKGRWKPLSQGQVEMLENCFKDYIETSPVDYCIANLGDLQVRFTPNCTDMQMLQPQDAPLRRTYLPGVKVVYGISPGQSSYQVQIHRIQIQNQLQGAIFPFVFYPVKPSKSIAKDTEPKPLIDLSIVTRSAGHSNISRIKYFAVLIQEMTLKLDLGFLYAISDFFTSEKAGAMTSQQEVELFADDIEYIKTELNHVSSTDTSSICLFENFHISPIKLRLSFSLSTGGEDGLKEKRETELIPVQSLNLLLKSIGATLTDVQDVELQLAFFQLYFKFYTTQQLQWEVITHYSKQAIKQMYVLVLGLDVLGNPFGLIRGLSEGVEAFFYEPYQGAILGPEEFVEGMGIGVKALVGGAVGGIAGAASRITGAMAKGVAAITMDEEFQQKRREAMNRQPTGLKDGLARGGKGLVSGFVSGITGIVTKPIKGAQSEGAAGFFKGIGKGLVGAIARPTGGIIDMASSTFQGIKRAAETSQDVFSLRPPRFIHEDGVIRPYKEREGIGSQMLQKIENGRFAKYKYFAHAKVNESDFFMITKRGIFFVTKGTFGQLTCEWQYLFEEFTMDPKIVAGRRLRIEAKERVKSVFHAKEFGKIINFKTPEVAKWVLDKLQDARPKY
ncbi:PREDICTED: vacuolar protein sorting-associated protein 13A isoform X2 [Cyprinodon variegatus]|uniref:vacuolar protein sorting-associated protein 13A isoform X2 n=1 Tax=Cyprinodon variegatus TaxID=28743 RepID=UPI00074268E4|nr:PREDICTED: vacuolar protein sorting-associated protein 13A isoform X2 [Cyprinodon variegatus]